MEARDAAEWPQNTSQAAQLIKPFPALPWRFTRSDSQRIHAGFMCNHMVEILQMYPERLRKITKWNPEIGNKRTPLGAACSNITAGVRLWRTDSLATAG